MVPALTPQAVRYELHVAEVNALLHIDAMMQGCTMVWPETLEAHRGEVLEHVARYQSAPAIDTDAWFDAT